MPPVPLLNLGSLDCDRVLYTKDQIYGALPQRFEFAQLDAVIHIDAEAAEIAAYRDVRADEWWCRGHMPEQPIFPGVLMVECAAQLASFIRHILRPDDTEIIGFGGIDKAKFRESVYPPARVILVGRAIDKRPRRFICEFQSFVEGKMVFEGQISGIRLKF